jgi:F-type H+-transporting ATPase subunit b
MELFVLTSLQSQYFWTGTAFLILLVVMARLVVPAVLGVLDARATQIATDLDTAAQQRQQAEGTLATYTSQLQAAKKEAMEIISAARAEAEAMVKTRTTQLEDELARKAEQATQQLNASKAEALRAVQAEVAAAAVTIAETLLRSQVDAKAATQLTTKLLAKGLNS